jgi:hypothetical protein
MRNRWVEILHDNVTVRVDRHTNRRVAIIRLSGVKLWVTGRDHDDLVANFKDTYFLVTGHRP